MIALLNYLIASKVLPGFDPRLISADVTQEVRDRYTQYALPEAGKLTGEALSSFIQEAVKAAHREKLVELEQLAALSEILNWAANSNREAPRGMY